MTDDMNNRGASKMLQILLAYVNQQITQIKSHSVQI